MAFADFVALKPGNRSLRNLHAGYVKRVQNGDKPPTVRFNTIADWSARFHWQDRVKAVATERAQQQLDEAAEIDADTFLTTSRLINERAHYAHPGDTDVVIKMRESVRKAPSKPSASIDLNGGPLTIVFADRADGPT